MSNTFTKDINMLVLNHNKLYIDSTTNKILNIVSISFIIIQIYLIL